jgi:hypothetical protein
VVGLSFVRFLFSPLFCLYGCIVLLCVLISSVFASRRLSWPRSIRFV